MSLIFILKPFPFPCLRLFAWNFCYVDPFFVLLRVSKLAGFNCSFFFKSRTVYFISCGSSSADHCYDFREFPSFDYCFTQATEKLCCLTLWTIDGPEIMFNRPFAGSSHMVRNKLHWDANDAVGLPKQKNSYQSSATILCFESPTASFASQCNLLRTM